MHTCSEDPPLSGHLCIPYLPSIMEIVYSQWRRCAVLFNTHHNGFIMDDPLTVHIMYI